MATYQELKGHRDLKVYQLAYQLAMKIYQESKTFSKFKERSHVMWDFQIEQIRYNLCLILTI